MVSMSCSKKQKGLESDCEMDHINKLPDALLCHILSFVPTKSAVATSVLSRRWVSIWTKVPVLDFTKLPRSMSYRHCEKKQFVRFMANVLLQNDISCLHRFHFEIYRDIESIYVKPWIDSILRREMWEIYLNREWYGPSIFMRLPMDLFARETLKVLKLWGTFEINVPLSLHLPKLETLYLYESRFVGKDVIKILTSGCPVLKELIIEYCEGIKELFIDSLTLNKLKISNKSQIISVKAPNVRYLDLDVRGSRYEVSNLSLLVEARIRLGNYEPWMLEFIRRLSDVQTLWLSQCTVELFGHFSENELPMFLNLTRLDIEIEHSMFQMLKCAPKLTHLSVNGNRSLKDNAALFPSEIVPHCISSIPNIEVRDFHCLKNDTELVRYILKNATVLKELKLHMHRVSLKRERDAFKKLLSFPRVSFCEVVICSSCESEKLPLHFPAISYT